MQSPAKIEPRQNNSQSSKHHRADAVKSFKVLLAPVALAQQQTFVANPEASEVKMTLVAPHSNLTFGVVTPTGDE
jgi:hypothetical protein